MKKKKEKKKSLAQTFADNLSKRSITYKSSPKSNATITIKKGSGEYLK